MSKETSDTKIGPPELYNMTTEVSLIGAAFLSPEIFHAVAAEDFGTPGFGVLWQACQELVEQGVVPDVATLDPEALPGGYVPMSFINACPSAVRAGQYAEVVKRWAKRRKLIAAADVLARAAYVDDDDERALLLVDAKDHLAESTRDANTEIYRLAGLLAMESQPIVDVVEGFIPGESVTIFSGDGGIGKSYVLIEMALQVAQGLPWLGMNCARMPVLVVDLENRLRRIVLRVHSIGKGWSLRKDVDYDVSFIFESDIHLGTDEGLEPLYRLIEEHGYGLVVLDSLVDFLGGLDENSNTEMSAVCQRLRDIAGRTGCSILAIHHVPKSGAGSAYQSARGASALKDNTDCSIQVIRSGGGAGDMITMRHDKARDFAYKSVKALVNWEDGMFNTTLFDTGSILTSTSGDKDEQAIMDCLVTTKWCKRSEVTREAMRQSGGSLATFKRKMKGLIDNGLVLEQTEGWSKSTGVKLA